MRGNSSRLPTIAILMLFVAPLGGCETEESEEKGTETIACPALHVLQGGTLRGPGVEHTGPVTGDETWAAADSPHVVSEWLVVEENHRLTIDPCAVVVMKDRTAIQIGSGWGAGGGSTPGDLVAVGTLEQPILVTGERKEPGAWARLEFNRTAGQSRLAHVTVEYAGDEDASEAATLVLTGPDTMAPAPLLTVEHVTLRSGAGVGLMLDGGGELSPTSQDLGIHGMSGRPVVAGAIVARSLPDGDYTGNGDDRIHLLGEGAVAPASAGDVTWRNLGVPYLYEIGTYQNWHSRLTLESGLEVFVMNDQDPELGLDDNGIIGVQCGGSIVAEGGIGDGVITFRGEGDRHWGGFNFERLEGSEDCDVPGVSRFAHVRLLHAGTQGSCNGDDACFDLEACTAAIKLNGPYLQMQDSEIIGTSGSMYAIAREYCGSGDEGLAGAGLGNRFVGPMHCPQTDQNECDPVGGACSENTTCCQHSYTCHGEVE